MIADKILELRRAMTPLCERKTLAPLICSRYLEGGKVRIPGRQCKNREQLKYVEDRPKLRSTGRQGLKESWMRVRGGEGQFFCAGEWIDEEEYEPKRNERYPPDPFEIRTHFF